MDGRRRQSSSSQTIDFFQASDICQKRMVMVMKFVVSVMTVLIEWVLGSLSSPTGSSTDLPLRKCVYALRNSWIGGSICTSFHLPTHIEVSSNRWHTFEFATASTLQQNDGYINQLTYFLAMGCICLRKKRSLAHNGPKSASRTRRCWPTSTSGCKQQSEIIFAYNLKELPSGTWDFPNFSTLLDSLDSWLRIHHDPFQVPKIEVLWLTRLLWVRIYLQKPISLSAQTLLV